ncbi:MAG: DUF1415 domain-containing protein, partial [Ferruginibacter sp.]
CPFAAREVKQDTIRYRVEPAIGKKECLQSLIEECIHLDNNTSVVTTLIILPGAFERFDEYLDIVSLCEELLITEGYEGIYQLASFHPFYQFSGTTLEDPANYTNRSVYPMLHILREEAIDKAVKKFGDAAKIPDRNISFATEKGLVYMKMLRESCF